MKFSSFLWDAPDDPEGNIEHIAEHGLTIDDIAAVFASPTSEDRSKSSGLPAIWGYTPDGRYVIVIFEEIDADTVYVVTSYAVPEPKPGRRKKKKR